MTNAPRSKERGAGMSNSSEKKKRYDMNVMFCLLYAAIYESCIHCRMIQSNTGYVELFEATTLAACIADRNGNIVLRSRAAGEDMVCPKEGLQVIRPNGIRISSAPIHGGYAVWRDNVRPMTELRAKLSENRSKIKNNKEKLHEAYLIQKKLNELTEKTVFMMNWRKSTESK